VSQSAEGAEYESQGQARSASPLVKTKKVLALKRRNSLVCMSALQASNSFCYSLPGATRFALAPGFHISRLWRSGSGGTDPTQVSLLNCKSRWH